MNYFRLRQTSQNFNHKAQILHLAPLSSLSKLVNIYLSGHVSVCEHDSNSKIGGAPTCFAWAMGHIVRKA